MFDMESLHADSRRGPRDAGRHTGMFFELATQAVFGGQILNHIAHYDHHLQPDIRNEDD
jgi:hypothetical protein